MEQTHPSGTPRVVMVLAGIAFALVALWGLQQIGGIVAPLLLTVNLYIAAYPVREWLLRLGVPRVFGTAILTLVVFAVLGIFFYSLVWSFTALVRELPAYEGKFWGLYHEIVQLLADLGITETQMLTQLRQLNPENVISFARSAFGGLSGAVAGTVAILIMVFMMAMDASTIAARDQQLTRHAPELWKSMDDFVHGVRRYWVVSTVFGLIVAALDVIALVWLGVPLALVWGILSFLTNYIPNVGFIIGVIPPMLIALLDQGWVTALLVLLVYSVLNFVIQAIIQPKFNGDAVGVTATVSFLSLLLWSFVLGPLGALLALPMTLLVKALLVDHDPNMRWLNALISNDPTTADPVAAPGASAEEERLAPEA